MKFDFTGRKSEGEDESSVDTEILDSPRKQGTEK